MSQFNRFKRPDTYPIGAVLEDTVQETRRIASDIEDTDERLDFAQQLDVASDSLRGLAREVRGRGADMEISFQLPLRAPDTIPVAVVDEGFGLDDTAIGSDSPGNFGSRVQAIRAETDSLDWGDESITFVSLVSETWLGHGNLLDPEA